MVTDTPTGPRGRGDAPPGAEEPAGPTPGVEEQVLAIALPKLEAAADRLKTKFMSAYGEFYEGSHKERLEELFGAAGKAKLKALAATDPNEARQWAQVVESSVRSIETLGLAASIKADAHAASLIKEAAAMVIDTLGDIASVLIGGIGSALLSGLIGPAAASLIEGAATEIAGSFRDDDQPNN